MEDNRKKKTRSAERSLSPKALKLLVTVVNKNKADFYIDFLQQFEVNLQLQMRAMGTAGSEMLHYLGLEESEKQVLFSIVREDMAPLALKGLEEKFATIRGGKGIAYTVPLTGVMGVAIYQFLSNNQMSGKDKKS